MAEGNLYFAELAQAWSKRKKLWFEQSEKQTFLCKKSSLRWANEELSESIDKSTSSTSSYKYLNLDK